MAKKNTSSTISTITTITTNQIMEVHALHAHLQLVEGCRKVPMITGHAGTGKSTMARRFAESDGFRLFDCRWANKLPSDVRLPKVDEEAVLSRFYVSEEIPVISGNVRADERIMFHLDEALQSPPVMQKILMQVVLDRCVGGHHFPAQTYICAAGNGQAHKSFAEKFGVAQADRFAWYHVALDLDGWLDQIVKSGKFPMLAAFIKANSTVPYDFDPAKFSGEEGTPTFRSLTEVGAVLNYYTRDGEINPTPLMRSAVTAHIGQKGGEALMAFIAIWQSVGSIEKMLKDPEGCKIPDDLTTKLIIACKLAGSATAKNMDAVAALANRFDPHAGLKGFCAALVTKTIAKTKPELMKSPAYAKMSGALLSSIM